MEVTDPIDIKEVLFNSHLMVREPIRASNQSIFLSFESRFSGILQSFSSRPHTPLGSRENEGCVICSLLDSNDRTKSFLVQDAFFISSSSV